MLNHPVFFENSTYLYTVVWFWVFVLFSKFYIGENMNPDGMVALLDYREDGVTPYMIFFKDGLEMEKCVSIKKWIGYHQIKV